MKSGAWLLRVGRSLLVVLLVFLVGLNLLLNLPVTQTLINQARPDRFQVQWQRAWSLWPTQLQLRGVRASGRTAVFEWEFETERIDTSVSLFALLNKTLALSDTELFSPDYRQRRVHPKETGDQFGSRMSDGSTEPGWQIRVRRARINGTTTFELPKLTGAVDGVASADISYQTRGGPLEISGGKLDLALESLHLNGGGQLVDRGRLSGEFALGPYVPREHRGKQSLNFLQFDGSVEFDTDSLAFLDSYLARFRQLKLSGAGHVEGQLRLGEGRVLAGSTLKVGAPQLGLSLFGFNLDGSGGIVLTVSERQPDEMSASILFDRVSGYAQDQESVLIEGQNLGVDATAPSQILIDRKTITADGAIEVVLERIAVPDIADYQRYIPTRLPLQLMKGEGMLTGTFVLDQEQAAGNLTLQSDQAAIRFRDLDINSGLELEIKATVDSLDTTSIDLAGTAIRLFDTSLEDGETKEISSSLFTTEFEIEEGRIKLDQAQFIDGARRWQKFVRDKNVDAMLENAAADLKMTGRVTSLDWINSLIDNPYGLAIQGEGELALGLKLDNGVLLHGSRLEISPEDIEIRFLDYGVNGQGSVVLSVTGDPDALDLDLNVRVTDARLGRTDDKVSHVTVDLIELDATANSVGQTNGITDMDMRLNIPAAQVHDMRVYNRYLPPSSPLQFTDGSAVLAADIVFEPERASGSVMLQTSGLQATLDDQQLAAELDVDVTIVGGTPSEMAFDVSGSTIRIDQVQVDGAAVSFDQAQEGSRSPWAVELVLDQATVNWRRPIELQTEASLTMSDTRPMVAVLANNRGEEGWLEKLLVVQNVSGQATLSVIDRKVIVPHMMIAAEDIQVGAKAVFEGQQRAGVVYARYKKLNGLLKFNGDSRNFDILRSRQKFERFDPSTISLANARSNQSQQSAARSSQWQQFEHLR